MNEVRAVVVDDRKVGGTRIRLVLTFDDEFVDAYRRNTSEPPQEKLL